MKAGYLRIHIRDTLDDIKECLDHLQAAECEIIYQDEPSKTISRKFAQHQPRLKQMLGQLKTGDIIVVNKLSRLSDHIRHLVKLVSVLQQIGVRFQSLQDNISTSSSTSALTANTFNALAEFQKAALSAQTRIGLEAAKARGRKGGRPKGIAEVDKEKATIAAQLYIRNRMSIPDICHHLDISKSTLYRYLKYKNIKIGKA